MKSIKQVVEFIENKNREYYKEANAISGAVVNELTKPVMDATKQKDRLLRHGELMCRIKQGNLILDFIRTK